MSERSGFGSFFVGFLAGAVAGAIATVLYAPNSGEETRNTLKQLPVKPETVLKCLRTPPASVLKTSPAAVR